MSTEAVYVPLLFSCSACVVTVSPKKSTGKIKKNWLLRAEFAINSINWLKIIWFWSKSWNIEHPIRGAIEIDK